MSETETNLGELIRVELRTVWQNESVNFTPWLATPENLSILGETLGLNLEPDSVEKQVGSFRADIVCRDIDTNSLVLIENQLEQTNHDHLGKLLTYAAGLHAVTVIWLAGSIRDEHRAALDWLNDVSHDDFSFFGLEIELWKIEQSLPAPKFNIVSKPNDWSRNAARVTSGSPDLNVTQALQLKYWESFLLNLQGANGHFSGERKARPQHWMNWSITPRDFSFSLVISKTQKFIRVELYITGENANEHLESLEQDKEEIEDELGFELNWGDQRQNAIARRISYYLRNIDISDESDWDRQHKWLISNLERIHAVTRRFIEAL